MKRRGIYYGWILVGVACVFYGFAISPAYYSWGIVGRAQSAELELTHAQHGFAFGLFSISYSLMGALAGALLNRLGVRVMVTSGLLATTLGFLWLSRVQSALETYAAFGLLIGFGVGVSSIVPAQTLASNWFIRYRGRAIAIIFAAGGIVAKGITKFDAWMLKQTDWRDIWLVFAGVSLATALLAATLVRNRPEDMGLLPDGEDAPPRDRDERGRPSNASAAQAAAPAPPPAPLADWLVPDALRSPQFLLILACAVAYSTPWTVVVSHGASHLASLGLEPAEAASIIGTMALVSVLGRLAGGVGDLVSPRLVLALSLLLEGLGVAGVAMAESRALASAACVMLGLGFGSAYISVPVVMGAFFGRVAFASTAGIRTMTTGLFNLAAAPAAGYLADTTGTFSSSFAALAVLCFIGTALAVLSRAPGGAPHLRIAGALAKEA